MTDAELAVALEVAKEVSKAGKELVLDMGKPLAKEVGATMAGLWHLTFGWIPYIDTKLRLQYAHNLAEFETELTNQVKLIPEKNKIEPKISVIGPAIEAAKFYLEEDSARKMFAKLIANSMNSDTAQFVQNAFVEIIKQMSTLDAKILKRFLNYQNQPIDWPFAWFIKNNDTGTGNQIIFDYVFSCDNADNIDLLYGKDIHKNGISISNLERLGLLKIRRDRFDLGEYSYLKYQKMLDGFITPGRELTADDKIRMARFSLGKGLIEVTPLGADFLKICL